MPEKSFIRYTPDSHFPIENVPFGIFSTLDDPQPRAGIAIGDYVLDLTFLSNMQLFDDVRLDHSDIFSQPSLNDFMALGRSAWTAAREAIQTHLQVDGYLDADIYRQIAFHKQNNVTMHLPASIGDYTDFFSSYNHAFNTGSMFRDPDNAILPNWRHLPVAYHGRASSVVVSGTPIQRPQGQTLPKGSDTPQFGLSRRLDIELEMGFFIGPGNELGMPINAGNARAHIFGLVLVNDWSARDIQKWEYVPLGPFLAKNFATTISPWIVTLDALDPFRQPNLVQEPPPLPYLQCDENWTYDINLEVYLQTNQMTEDTVISHSNSKNLYWTMAQQIAHHTITGCNMRPGDLLASGTISGPTPDSYGSLLEMSWGGQQPISLPNGETRTFLEDGDTITLSGYAQGDGYRIGFGECVGKIMPAIDISLT